MEAVSSVGVADSKPNGNNLNNIRNESGRNFRNERWEYLKEN
jgi:hypothetical protein